MNTAQINSTTKQLQWKSSSIIIRSELNLENMLKNWQLVFFQLLNSFA